MTNKEATKILKEEILGLSEDNPFYEAVNLAIKALEERPTGRWTSEDFDEWYECSNCLKGDTYFDGLPNFCPNCGADMR